MKKTKFAEVQILFALTQGNAGQSAGGCVRADGTRDATYYVWKKRQADPGILEVRELSHSYAAGTRA